MSDAIIVLNAGSSSLKFSIYQVNGGDDDDDGNFILVSHGLIDSSTAPPRFKARNGNGAMLADVALDATANRVAHADLFAHLVRWARQEFGGTLSIIAVGHRVVHGGLEFIEPTLLDEQIIEKLQRLVPLVPLHQPHALEAIRAVRSLRPDLPQVACFDTAFHRGRATVTERMGLPDELFQHGLRRWGFHGLSYASIVEQLRQIAPELAGGRIIVAHLGSGASMCAIRGGRSIDTTMSFSVLDGLPMGTRCGSLDPGALLFLMKSRSYEEIESLLYKQSGLLGISGVSNDMRELLSSPNRRAAEAIEYFVYRAVREVGSLTAALGGLDGLVFTAGVGENSPAIRQRICASLGWLGLAIDPAANDRGRGCISPPGRSPSVWVIATDEERIIATGTWNLVRAKREQPRVEDK